MKILINRRGALGDVIMTTGIVRALKQQYPDAQIDVATDSAEVFLDNIYIQSIASIDRFDTATYDLVIDLDMAYEMSPGIHAIDAYAAKAKLDSATADLHTELFVRPEHLKFLDQFKLPEKFLVIHQRQHFWSNRNLPMEFYIELISKIIERTGLAVVQIGGNSDFNFGNIDGCLYDLTKQLNLHQSAALISKAKAFIGVDAGPLHIASTTNTPIIGLFTSVKAEYREPRNRSVPHINVASNIDCYGCVEKLPAPVTQYYCARGNDQCTRSFSADDIIEKLKTLL